MYILWTDLFGAVGGAGGTLLGDIKKDCVREELLQTLTEGGGWGEDSSLNSLPQRTLVGLVELELAEGVPESSVLSPQSVSSSDSGQFSSLTDEDQFLAGLFGNDFPLSNSPLSFNQDQALLPLIQVGGPLKALGGPMPEPKTENPSDGGNTFACCVAALDEKVTDRSRKNAESARLNRIKKKQYVEGLEKERSSLKTENVILKTRCHELGQNVKKLQSEVEYLKSVLANESTLSSLIKNIPSTPNVRLSSSFSRKRPNPDSKSSPSLAKRAKPVLYSGGVCLHVSDSDISLEFCQHCSKTAAEGLANS